MEHAFNELPLALFTTLASIGAGGFIALTIAFYTTQFSDEQLKKIDKLTLVPAIAVIIGFIAAFFHLANPAAAFGVFNGLGRSPMSNELVVAIIFAVVMIVYVIMALSGKLGGARKPFAVIVSVLAIVFAAFMGLAYSIQTVMTWSTPWPVVQMIGYTLLGGAAMGTCVLSAAGCLEDAVKGPFKSALVATAVIGLVLALLGLCLMAVGASGQANGAISGALLLENATICLIVSVAGLAISCVLVFMASRGAQGMMLGAGSLVLALVGVLAGRLVFYALELSAGLFF